MICYPPSPGKSRLIDGIEGLCAGNAHDFIPSHIPKSVFNTWKVSSMVLITALTSLKKCIAKYGSYLATPYVLHTADLKVEKGITYLPLYMTGLL